MALCCKGRVAEIRLNTQFSRKVLMCSCHKTEAVRSGITWDVTSAFINITRINILRIIYFIYNSNIVHDICEVCYSSRARLFGINRIEINTNKRTTEQLSMVTRIPAIGITPWLGTMLEISLRGFSGDKLATGKRLKTMVGIRTTVGQLLRL